MSRKKKNKNSNKSFLPNLGAFEDFQLHHETKKSVWAVIFAAIAIILFLARFRIAGPVGSFFYDIFEWLFGIGYYLLPMIFLVMAGVFLASERRRIYKITFIGAVLFVLSGLGLIDVIFPEKSGAIGRVVGLLEIPFGYTASIVILSAIILSSLLITLNLPIKIKKLKIFKEKEEDENRIKEKPLEIEIKESTAIAGDSKKEKEEKIEEEKNLVIISNSQKIKKLSSAARSLLPNYVFPPLDLLRSSVEKPTVGDLRASANIIKRTLDSFGIPVEMGEINIGPKVTRYTLKPAEGIKLSRLTALNQDLALALAAHPLRIEAPIPGKSLVGIEVPNKVAAIVRLGSLMNYPEFGSSGRLSFILGRDVTGEPILGDIEKMPHLLIAGSTGSGKSIALHSLLTSLLYKNSPDMLKMILIDPKRVELSIYNGIPHLIAPVITQTKKTIGVFRWAIDEMDKRYEILMMAGSRDIQSYNKKNSDNPLPFIVIVIDELADLMSTYGREVEGAIVRLAQMARATGIHLIVSTQRPSVEVITGLIKANITSRIALQVASQIDSRTILDMAGAEKLLGGGDMLFISSELSKPKRVQGAYISEDEIKKVASFVRDNNKNIIPDNFEETPNFENKKEADDQLQGDNEDMFSQYNNQGDNNSDELYDEAIEIVKAAGKASASLLQRRLKVGYARAARLLDIMESKGAIGPGDGAKPREVYIGQ